MTNIDRFLLQVLLGTSVILAACGEMQVTSESGKAQPNRQADTSKTDGADAAIRFFEEKIKRNPGDFVAHNKLAAEYLRIVRETGDPAFLDLALRAANRSLEIRAPEQNLEGLAVLALVKYSSHDFAGARAAGLRLTELVPDRGYSYQILGDALLELGEYENAKTAFARMTEFGGVQVMTKVGTLQRLARLAILSGDTKKARTFLSNALKLAESIPEPPRGTVALCQLLLGELAFSGGDYKTSERHFRAALDVFPEYISASAALGRARAAQGDLTGAIQEFETVARRLPDPVHIAYLGDLYNLTGRGADSQNQYELVERISEMNSATGALYDRQLALFYADHDLQPEKAYAIAVREYESRSDIYGADTLAWAALKAGKLPEAQARIKEAMRLGTLDSRFFYHAGMIEKAAGNNAEAKKMLEAALKLNPAFDPLQAEKAKNALAELK